jgi:hypothetical protein
VIRLVAFELPDSHYRLMRPGDESGSIGEPKMTGELLCKGAAPSHGRFPLPTVPMIIVHCEVDDSNREKGPMKQVYRNLIRAIEMAAPPLTSGDSD